MIVTRMVETQDEISKGEDGTPVQFVFRCTTDDPDYILITIGCQPDLAISRGSLCKLAVELLTAFGEAP